MTSIVPNEKFKLNAGPIKFIVLFLTSGLFILIILDQNTISELISNFLSQENKNIKIFNTPSNLNSIFIINYLFIVIIVITKLVKINLGPLRRLK
jgi:hypothetical protein